MLSSSQSIKINLYEKDTLIGKLKLSKFIKDIKLYKIPFVKTSAKVLVKVGTGDYNDFDSL